RLFPHRICAGAGAWAAGNMQTAPARQGENAATPAPRARVPAAAPCPGLSMNTPPVPSVPPTPDVPALRAAITAAWALDEASHVGGLLAIARQPAVGWGDADRAAVHATATDLVQRVR